MEQDNPVKVFAGIIVLLLVVIGGIAAKDFFYPNAGGTADQMTATVKNFFGSAGKSDQNSSTTVNDAKNAPNPLSAKNAVTSTSSVDAQIDAFTHSTSTLPNPSNLGETQ
jgi:hypothetical protein